MNFLFVMSMATMILFVESQSVECSWCANQLECLDSSEAFGWTLVRANGATRNAWFNNTDNLEGTDPYFDNQKDIYNIGVWEDYVPGFNQYSFMR